MTVAAYRDRATGRYPITLDDLRRSAGMLFGEEPTQAVLDFVGVDRVEAVAAPAFDPATQRLVEGEPSSSGSNWVQTWIVQALPPTPETFPPITPRQFFQALSMPPYGIVSPQEALDAVKTGEIPAVMQAVIDSLPEDRQYGATMVIAGGQQFNREDPLVAIFGGSQAMDADAINAFWRFARSL